MPATGRRAAFIRPGDSAAPCIDIAPGLARRRWLTMAASVLVAAGIAGGLWLAAPGASLAADVVSHMAEEPRLAQHR